MKRTAEKSPDNRGMKPAGEVVPGRQEGTCER